MAEGAVPGAPLAPECFPLFYELLEACQEYAALTGGRFLKCSNSLPSAAREALVKAEPVIEEFSQRLKLGEEELLDGIYGAVQLVMKEGVRSGILATCRELEMWPPRPVPSGVSDDDCSYEDTSSPFPVIAQRLYNDEQRRLREAAMQPLVQRALTASFLADFAGGIGVSVPSMSESHHGMLEEFMARVQEWASQRQGAHEASLSRTAETALMQGIGLGAVADSVRQELQMRWEKNWETHAGTALNIATVGVAILGGFAMLHGASRRRR